MSSRPRLSQGISQRIFEQIGDLSVPWRDRRCGADRAQERQQRRVGQIVNCLRRIDHVVQPFVFTKIAVAVELAFLQAKVHDFAALSDSVVTSSNLAKEMTHDLVVNFNKYDLFSGENTANELQENATKTQDTLYAEVAEIERAVFWALTLRAWTKEFDTFGRWETPATETCSEYQRLPAEHTRS